MVLVGCRRPALADEFSDIVGEAVQYHDPDWPVLRRDVYQHGLSFRGQRAEAGWRRGTSVVVGHQVRWCLLCGAGGVRARRAGAAESERDHQGYPPGYGPHSHDRPIMPAPGTSRKAARPPTRISRAALQ